MFLVMQGEVHDFDFELLEEVVALLDRQIEKIEAEIDAEPLAYDLGYGDRIESVVGLGFVACQQYIHATYPQLASDDEDKLDVLRLPPMNAGGRSVAEIVNAAANYWKHSDEWSYEANLKRERSTRDVLESVVSPGNGYALYDVLCGLAAPGPTRFAAVLRHLTAWRDGRA